MAFAWPVLLSLPPFCPLYPYGVKEEGTLDPSAVCMYHYHKHSGVLEWVSQQGIMDGSVDGAWVGIVERGSNTFFFSFPLPSISTFFLSPQLDVRE